jgi:hypothetical protein
MEGWEKQFVRRGFVFTAIVSPHRKFPGWDDDHSSKLAPLSLHLQYENEDKVTHVRHNENWKRPVV